MATPAVTKLGLAEPEAVAKTPAKVQKEPFDSAKYLNDNKFHVLLAASGSVATIKIPNIIQYLSKSIHAVSIRLVITKSAAEFLQGQSNEQPSLASIATWPNVDGVYFDEDEWAIPWTRGAKILHIELRRWADIMVIAPLSANTLAKMAGGHCDNLLLSTIRAWDTTGILDFPHTVKYKAADGEQKSTTYPSDFGKKRILVAPAMNSAMWVHPITQRHMKVLEDEWGVDQGGWVEIMKPIERELACGDVGPGAMCLWQTIADRVVELLTS